MTTRPVPAETRHLLPFAGLVVDGRVQLHGDKGELVLRFTRLAG